MSKRIVAAVVATSLAAGGAAWAQSTALGPNITSVAVTVGGALAVLAANPSRKRLTVCNNDASNKVTIATGSTSPVQLTTGLVLLNGNVATSCFTFDSGSAGGGGGVGAQINAIASGGTVNVTFIEYF